jgi:Cu+-exporting ATPase
VIVSEQRLSIKGMTCASCASRVEKALAAVPKVERVAVNLALGEAKVFGEGHLPLLGLLEAARRTGYDAEPLIEEDGGRALEAVGEEGKQLDRDLLLAAPLSLVLMILAMAGPHGFGWGLLQGVLATLVLAWPGRRFFAQAWRLAIHRTMAMETLIALGTGAAWLGSTLALFRGGHLYYESAAVIITLILLGRRLEAGAKRRAADAIGELSRLLPGTAERVDDEGRSEDVPVSELEPGDRVRVPSGSRVPVDGVVIQGEGTVDESLLTGESRPARKTAGEAMTGGTLLLDGHIELRVASVGEQTVLAGIVRLVREAQASKAPVQRLADRVAGIFVPVVLALAALTVLLHLLLAPEMDRMTVLLRAVAVLIIACPCALGLATPTAILVGSGMAARMGILFRDAASLERLQGVRLLAVDKTGTLTRGRPKVARFVPYGPEPQDRLFRLIAAAEASVSHPLARAMREYCEHRADGVAFAVSVVARAGGGVKAEVQGKKIVVGAPWFLEAEGVDIDEAAHAIAELEDGGMSPVLVAVEERLAGVFGLEDELRPEVPALIQQLAEMGIESLLLSGDRPEAVRRTAAQAGIMRWEAGLRPEDKARVVRQLAAEGLGVAMLGDGVNDAPALAAADVGIALSSGADAAVASASVTLVKGGLHRVIDGVRLSRRTLKTIKENLFWAFFYNVLAIPLAALGVLHPMIAAGAMAASSLFVVTNSLRLRGLGAWMHRQA